MVPVLILVLRKIFYSSSSSSCSRTGSQIKIARIRISLFSFSFENRNNTTAVKLNHLTGTSEVVIAILLATICVKV